MKLLGKLEDFLEMLPKFPRKFLQLLGVLKILQDIVNISWKIVIRRDSEIQSSMHEMPRNVSTWTPPNFPNLA